MKSKVAVVVWSVVVLLSHFYTVSLFEAVRLHNEAIATWLIVNSITGIIYSWGFLLFFSLGMDRIMDNCGWGLLYMAYVGFGFLYLIALAATGYYELFEKHSTSELWTIALMQEIIYGLLALFLVAFVCIAFLLEACGSEKSTISLK